jgi:hypothetical protein
MPIKVSCKCGQQFAAKDELAGRVVKCPKCQQPLKIAAAQPPQTARTAAPSGGVADLLDEIGFHVHEDEKENVQYCPACDSRMSERAVICVACGFNLETGKFVKGVGGVAGAEAKAEGHAGAAQMLLKKAEHAIKKDSEEEEKIRKEGMPTWVLVTLLTLLVTFAVGMSLLPRATALFVTGWVYIVTCWLVSTYYGIRLILVAFTEGWKVGLMFLFLPFYWVYFVITRWDQCSQPFLMNAIIGLVSNFGWALLAWSEHYRELDQEGGGVSAVFVGEFDATYDPAPLTISHEPQRPGRRASGMTPRPQRRQPGRLSQRLAAVKASTRASSPAAGRPCRLPRDSLGARRV